jgi:hypothetical protein
MRYSDFFVFCISWVWETDFYGVSKLVNDFCAGVVNQNGFFA